MARLNSEIENRPVFLLLSVAFSDFAEAVRERTEKTYLRGLSDGCMRRYERQKAWADVGPAWERDYSPGRGVRSGKGDRKYSSTAG
jgi:hypothetical protein